MTRLSYLALCAAVLVVGATSVAACDAANITGGIPISGTIGVERIQKALDEPTDLEFNETPLSDVIEFLKHKHHVQIQLDKKCLEEAGVPTDTPITRNLKGVSLRSALRLMLRDLPSELKYIIRDEVLLITAKVTAETLPETRVYPVCDLVKVPSENVENPTSDYETLIGVISSCVAPTTWLEVGGQGSIKAMPNAESLVISQTQEIHEEIDALLATLRKARDAQAAK